MQVFFLSPHARKVAVSGEGAGPDCGTLIQPAQSAFQYQCHQVHAWITVRLDSVTCRLHSHPQRQDPYLPLHIQ